MTKITIARSSPREWIARVDDSPEWLPLPFTPEADAVEVADFYEDRFDVVVCTAMN